MHDSHHRACQYIKNTGGAPSIAWFDDDHEPIGPKLRSDMAAAGLVKEEAGFIRLTEAGVAAAAS